jgi:hypothetical protein
MGETVLNPKPEFQTAALSSFNCMHANRERFSAKNSYYKVGTAIHTLHLVAASYRVLALARTKRQNYTSV